jgi:hypothetical protein
MDIITKTEEGIGHKSTLILLRDFQLKKYSIVVCAEEAEEAEEKESATMKMG